MNKLMQSFLELAADRISALIARLVTNEIEVRCAEQQAELQCRLEHLSTTYDEKGQPEIAGRLRSLAQKLSTDAIVPSGEALLSQMYASSPPIGLKDSNSGSTTEAPFRSRRSTTKRVVSLDGPPSDSGAPASGAALDRPT